MKVANDKCSTRLQCHAGEAITTFRKGSLTAPLPPPPTATAEARKSHELRERAPEIQKKTNDQSQTQLVMTQFTV